MPSGPKNRPISDVYDDAIKGIIQTVAQSRFTHAPIQISRAYSIPAPATGRYTSSLGMGPGNISVQLGSDPSYDDFNRVLHHEDIHSALRNENLPSPFNLMQGLNTSISGHRLANSIQDARASWNASSRGGQMPLELPAYSGSFEPGKLVGYYPNQADDYVEAIKRVISPESSSIYQRIIDNIKNMRR